MGIIEAVSEYPGLEHLKGNMKKPYNQLISHGTIPFSSDTLQQAIVNKVVKKGRLPEHGERILKIEKKGYCFARLVTNKLPERQYEIALSVFIQKYNKSCYAQFTLSGKTANWDILNKKDNNAAEFIELKEWDSRNSPLYALVEALIYIELYKHILKIKPDCNPHFSYVSISILAPIQYYTKYKLFSESKNNYTDTNFRSLIGLCEDQFDIKISLKAIKLEKVAFNKLCRKAPLAKDQRGLKQENYERATVEDITFTCPGLLVENWETILE